MRSALLVLACAAALFSQEPAARNVVFHGDIVDSLTGAPVSNALASVQEMGPNGQRARSDVNGHVLMEGPVKWGFEVYVRRPGYLDRHRHVDVKPDENSATLRIELIPQAVISGRVTDEDGFPVAGAVDVLHYEILFDHRPQLVRFNSVPCNDRGEFRIAGLSAGHYYLRAIMSSEMSMWDSRYVPQFYPGTLAPADAGVIEVKAGEQRSGIEFHAAKQRGATLSGRALMADGSRWAGYPPTLSLNLNDGIRYLVANPVQAQADGSFSIPHVPPGNFIIEARNGNSPGDLAVQEIQVGSDDVRNIALTLHAPTPVDLPGTVVLEGGPTSSGPYSIELTNNEGRHATAISDENGAFVLKGVLPGHYSVIATPAAGSNGLRLGWFPDSYLYGGREIRPNGLSFDGTSSDTLRLQLKVPPRSGVRGQVLDANGQAVSAAAILLQGDDPAQRVLIGSRDDGTFQADALPPGRYHVYAVADAGQAHLLDDPMYRQAHSGDFPVVTVVDKSWPAITLKLR
jgi:hypothetical protein